MGSKTCRVCQEVKPVDQFYPSQRHRSGRDTRCRQCAIVRVTEWGRRNPERVRATRRRVSLRSNYGITPEDVQELVETQGGRCVICLTPEPGGNGTWHVDHDHDTGDIRGILCRSCNVGLGNAKDSPENLAASLVYLASHGRFMSTPTLIQFLGALSAAHKIGENHQVTSTA